MPPLTDTRTERHPLAPEGAEELAVLQRSGFDESRHLGAAVLVDRAGAVLDVIGDAEASVYPRSTMKPFQAIAARRAGAVFADAELVLSTASHAGTDAHRTLVSHMLTSHGHTEDDLGCPPDYPADRAAARGMEAPTRLAMNCSGKHAAMLAACDVAGWDLATYLDPEHPLQRSVRATVEEFTGERVDHVGTDGCGAPVFPLTLRGLARGIAGVTAGSDPDAAAIVGAVLRDPWALDGHGRENTVTIERLQIFAKLGAEGVMVMGVPNGPAVAVKVLDGSSRARTLAALAILERNGLVDHAGVAEVLARTGEQVLGGGRSVGTLRLGGAFAA